MYEIGDIGGSVVVEINVLEMLLLLEIMSWNWVGVVGKNELEMAKLYGIIIKWSKKRQVSIKKHTKIKLEKRGNDRCCCV